MVNHQDLPIPAMRISLFSALASLCVIAVHAKQAVTGVGRLGPGRVHTDIQFSTDLFSSSIKNIVSVLFCRVVQY